MGVTSNTPSGNDAIISINASSENSAISRNSLKPGRQRKSIRQNYHRFVIGNPCGPCEWHIEQDVRIFAWFDLVFQSIFIIPAILSFRVFLKAKNEPQHIDEPHVKRELECDEDKIDLAIQYGIGDLINLGTGVFSDIIIYIGTKQKSSACSIITAITFLVIALLREALHIYGVVLHILRCSPPSYPYEIVVRALCHYNIWGFWIVIEYLVWVIRGKNFVPRRGMMEPPIVQLKYVEMDETSSMALTATASSWSQADPMTIDSNQLGISSSASLKKDGGGDEQRQKRRSKRRSNGKRKSSEEDAELMGSPSTVVNKILLGKDGKKK